MVTPHQGDVWWAEAEDKRRPVLVVTRSDAIGVLSTIVVAPVTRRIRGIPTEIRLDPDDGMPEDSVATFDALQPIRRTFLTERITRIDNAHSRICRALSAFADC